MRPAISTVTLTLAAATLLGGCENGVKDMYHQARNDPLTYSALWPDGRSSRPLEAGTLAHSAGPLAESSSGRGGVIPPPGDGPVYTTAALERGRQEFDIYCAPCHGVAGDGDGYITHRGFPHPPSYHSEQLREAPDRLFYDVITNGYGIMYPYGDRLASADRWMSWPISARCSLPGTRRWRMCRRRSGSASRLGQPPRLNVVRPEARPHEHSSPAG